MKSIAQALSLTLAITSQLVEPALASPVHAKTTKSVCNPSQLQIRKEWGALTSAEKIEFTNAVVCLQHKPSLYSGASYPGVRSHYDDFVAVHINYTQEIHLDGLFLPWHRQFIYLFAQALQTECGYTGQLPYWDWPRWAGSLETSPLFDGSATSLSGNGAYDPSSPLVSPGVNMTFPHGTGGGCITSGPFKNYSLNLGPFDFSLLFTSPGVLPANAFAANPRCFTRDLNDAIAENYTNGAVVEQLLAAPNNSAFQGILSGPVNTWDLGPHAGGHACLGNSLFDFFASPQDPAFFLHHSQIDRIWALWQAENPTARIYGYDALSGTETTLNIPPSPNATLSSLAHFGKLDRDYQLSELMSPLAGGFCYIYE